MHQYSFGLCCDQSDHGSRPEKHDLVHLENKRWDFLFCHLQWCHNVWTSNILSGGCRRSQYPPRLKYWMPIHYDTIEDGQNKKSQLLFSFLVRIMLFLHFIGRIYLSKILLHHFIGFIWIITPLMKKKCFNPRNQINRVAFVTCVNSVCVQIRHVICGVHAR